MRAQKLDMASTNRVSVPLFSNELSCTHLEDDLEDRCGDADCFFVGVEFCEQVLGIAPVAPGSTGLISAVASDSARDCWLTPAALAPGEDFAGLEVTELETLLMMVEAQREKGFEAAEFVELAAFCSAIAG